jgi:hypothetical protein
MTQFCKLFLLASVVFLSCKKDDITEAKQNASATFDQIAETDAIMSVIDNETACFFARDYACWSAHFAHVEYAFQSWNRADGTYDAKVGWADIDKSAGQYIKDNPVPPGGSSHPKVEKKNVKIHFFNGTLAYLSWDQYNSNQEANAFTHSLETRIMEKFGHVWKIVNVTSYWDYVNLVPADSLN